MAGLCEQDKRLQHSKYMRGSDSHSNLEEGNIHADERTLGAKVRPFSASYSIAAYITLGGYTFLFAGYFPIITSFVGDRMANA